MGRCFDIMTWVSRRSSVDWQYVIDIGKAIDGASVSNEGERVGALAEDSSGGYRART